MRSLRPRHKVTTAGSNGSAGSTSTVTATGSFSAHVGGNAAMLAAVYAAATGAPIVVMAKGRSYVTRFDVDGSGNKRGLLVATVGGTGRSARLRLSATAKQTDVSGLSIERFLGNGAVHSSLGSPRGLSAACRAVAGLPHS